MDLAFTDEQASLRDLAKQIFIGYCTDDKLRALEESGAAIDPELWTELARAHLLGFGVPGDLDGNGGGILELCLLLEQAGRAAAPVPLWAALAGGTLPLAMYGSEEQKSRLLPDALSDVSIIAPAFEEPVSRDPLSPACVARIEGDEWRLDGVKSQVPGVAQASRVIVSALAADGVGLFLVDPSAPGVVVTDQPNTAAEPLSQIELYGVRIADADVLLSPDSRAPFEIILDHMQVGLCALQLGIAEHALRLTAEYSSGREQFGRPLASFQAVQQRAADAYVDVEAMRWTMWRAAWLLSEHLPATDEVLEAKYFASEGGHRVLAAAQHLHGGIGVDMTYPLHRYTFMAKQAELTLGGATAQLAKLGDRMASV
jgi:alkylation response protein AidB-like acyl-CoA dehydrogenase